jgi:histidinol-phosphate aminotransferase
MKNKFILEDLIRDNIKKLIPYSSARAEFKGEASVFLDANENAFGSPLANGGNINRYPDPYQIALKEKLGKIKGLPVENIFLGNGSDEAIDILYRSFCNPGKDNVVICPPAYGMYEVSADINDVELRRVSLLPETFQLDPENILEAIDEKTKLIFLCCPNNPSGNGVKWSDIRQLLENFSGLVIADEAYINYASYRSLIPELMNYPNLVILQTLSKAWGLAGLRIGMAFASQQIIDVFNKVKPPYNLNGASQQLALEALNNIELVNERIRVTVAERKLLAKKLAALSFVIKVYPSEANFLLVKVDDPGAIHEYLAQKGIVIRDRSSNELCDGCLRITIGTPEENEKLMNELISYSK